MQGVVYVSFNDWIISMVVACIVGGNEDTRVENKVIAH